MDSKPWTQQEQEKLDRALQTYPKGSFELKERWQRISAIVGRSAKECAVRYQDLRNSIKAKQPKSVEDEVDSKVKAQLNTEAEVFEPKSISIDKKACDEPEQSSNVSLKKIEPKENVEVVKEKHSISEEKTPDSTKSSIAVEMASGSDNQAARESGKVLTEVPVSKGNNKKAAKSKNKKESAAASGENDSTTAALVGPSPKKQLCRNFQKGSCKHGDSCKYAHSSENQPADQDSDILKTEVPASKSNNKKAPKSKNKKESAAATTDSDSTAAALAGPLPKKQLCRNFQKGSCKHGDSCKYAHSSENQSADQDSDILKTEAPASKNNNQKTAKSKNKKESAAASGENDSTTAALAGPSPKKQLCRNFQKGSCKHGDSCKYAHTSENQSADQDGDILKTEGLDSRDKRTKPKSKKAKGGGWWKQVDDVDPISLEPISDLKYPPFELKHSSDSAVRGNLYDGKLLSLYFVASGIFEDPMNRRELSVAECAELDDYLRRNRLGPPWAQVESAFKLKHEQRAADEVALAGALPRSHGRSSNQARATTLQREAAGLLLSMFGISVANNDSREGAGAPTRVSQRASQRRSRGPSNQNNQLSLSGQEHVQGGGGHAMIDDDFIPSYQSASQSSSMADVLFPSLPETSNKVVPVPWVQVKPPPSQKPPASTGSVGPTVSEGILTRNIRMKEALGLGTVANRDTALSAAAQERQACVWPPCLMQWVNEKRGEVMKIERKLHDLMMDPRGTSVALKPMIREERRYCHMMAEFYVMGSRSDDNNDKKGKCLSFIRTASSTIPWPLLSEAHSFERAHPDLIAKSIRLKEEEAFKKSQEELGQGESSCWLLLKGVPDLVSVSDIRRLLMLFTQDNEVVDLWQVALGSTRLEDGLEYCLVLSSAQVMDRVFREASDKPRLPFTVCRWPAMMSQKPDNTQSGRADDSWTVESKSLVETTTTGVDINGSEIEVDLENKEDKEMPEVELQLPSGEENWETLADA